MLFRYAIGSFIALIGSIALAANSYLLGTGALRWAGEHDVWQQAALASGGAIVPWMLAMVPLLFITIPESAGFISRNRQRSTIIGLWALFFAYNFIMGTSNNAQLRENSVALHEHTAETISSARDQRALLRQQLADVPRHRPADVVSALLLAEQSNIRWTTTEGCTDATASRSRTFCDNYRTLEGELAAAKKADELTAKVAAIDAEIAAAPANVDAAADPLVDGIHALTGIPKKYIRVMLAMATPVVLEVLGASCWHYAVGLFGWTLSAELVPRSRHSEPAHDLLASPEAIDRAPPTPLSELTRQRQLCEWYFRECAKPIAGGSMSEAEWYAGYEEICRRHNDKPVNIETFRRIAARNRGLVIQDIDGEKFYQGYLPLVPA